MLFGDRWAKSKNMLILVANERRLAAYQAASEVGSSCKYPESHYDCQTLVKV